MTEKLLLKFGLRIDEKREGYASIVALAINLIAGRTSLGSSWAGYFAFVVAVTLLSLPFMVVRVKPARKPADADLTMMHERRPIVLQPTLICGAVDAEQQPLRRKEYDGLH